MLARAQKITGNFAVAFVGCANGNRLYVGVVQNRAVIGHGGAAAVFFYGSVGAFGQDIAKIQNLRFGVFQIRRNVRMVRYGTAADDSNFHGDFSLHRFLYWLGERPSLSENA